MIGRSSNLTEMLYKIYRLGVCFINTRIKYSTARIMAVTHLLHVLNCADLLIISQKCVALMEPIFNRTKSKQAGVYYFPF